MAFVDSLNDSLKTFQSLTAKPEKFLSNQEEKSDEIKSLVKTLYDVTKNVEGAPSASSSALPQLIVKDFDEEQIWQEIELQNDDRWNRFIEDVSKFMTPKNDFSFPISNAKTNGENVAEDLDEPDASNDELLEDDDESEDAWEMKPSNESTRNASRKYKKSIVDDKFFKLHELEAFLEAEDKKEMKKDKMSQSKNLDDDSDDEDEDEEDEIDLFADWESDEGMNDEDADRTDYKYNEFFDNVDDDDNEFNKNDNDSVENDSKVDHEKSESDDLGFDDEDDDEMDLDDENYDLSDSKVKSKEKKKVRFNVEQPSSSDDEGEENGDKESKTEQNLSQFEIRQERLKKKIGHLEDNLLREKSWTMKGEVTATSRPQNSLLEEILDFDMTSRPAPVITEETTVKLQDIIIQRIKDKTWDDVERKIKPLQDVPEFKKQIVLDQEKSKLSLAQVYEQDYIKQRDALDPDADEKPEEEPKEHTEIRTLMKTLFSKLEALSNFHYTPKVAVPEVKIVANIPAISMEEVAPVATSDAALLAPEEVKTKPKGDVIGKSERTDTDKKRERRQKKLKQRLREIEKEKRNKLVEKLNPGLGNKYSKEKAKRLLEKVSKDRNVEKMETIADNRAIKSSTAFFTQLQEEAQNAIKSKTKINKKTKEKINAKMLKL